MFVEILKWPLIFSFLNEMLSSWRSEMSNHSILGAKQSVYPSWWPSLIWHANRTALCWSGRRLTDTEHIGSYEKRMCEKAIKDWYFFRGRP